MRCFCFLAPAAPKKTRRTMERRLRLVNFVWLKHFLASSASTFMLSLVEAQAKPAYFGRLSINFSKAGLATLEVLYFNPNFKTYHQKKCVFFLKWISAPHPPSPDNIQYLLGFRISGTGAASTIFPKNMPGTSN